MLKSYGATHVVDRTLPPNELINDVKAIAGEYVDLAYDAISTQDTLELSGELLRPGGQLVFVVPGRGELIKDVIAQKKLRAICARGLLTLKQNRGALNSLLVKVPELLEQGLIRVRADSTSSPSIRARTLIADRYVRFQPVPYEVLPGGLRAVPGGLERLRDGHVNAAKLVVLPPDTSE